MPLILDLGGWRKERMAKKEKKKSNGMALVRVNVSSLSVKLNDNDKS